MCIWDSFWQCHLPVTLHRYKNDLDRISPWVRPVLNKKNGVIRKWVDLSFNLVLKICKCCVCHLLPNASPLIFLSLHYLTTHETCWDVYLPFTCATNQQFWIVLLPDYFLHKHFLFKWGLPYCVSPLCHPVMPDTHCSRQKSSAAPCVTSTCHAKRCAWHMHRSLLSLNARLEQPSERRLAHRLCHQSRWADHSEYIESLSSVKSALDSTLGWLLQKYPRAVCG